MKHVQYPVSLLKEENWKQQLDSCSAGIFETLLETRFSKNAEVKAIREFNNSTDDAEV